MDKSMFGGKMGKISQLSNLATLGNLEKFGQSKQGPNTVRQTPLKRDRTSIQRDGTPVKAVGHSQMQTPAKLYGAK